MAGEAGRPLRVLAAEDSSVMREMIRTVFDLHAARSESTLPAMELCGFARDGVEAVEAVRTLAPDVLLLDLEMPRLDGLGVLHQLRRVAPRLPVIMCSAHTARGAKTTLDGLALGAKDYVMKPAQQKDFASALDSLMEQLLPRIAALAGGREEVRGTPPALEADSRRARRPEALSGDGSVVGVVVIGVSTGGPSALELMLPMLPRDLAVPVLIVQHMPRLFTSALAERLNRMCQMPVRQAAAGVAIGPGTVWMAPGDAHMEIAPGAGWGTQGGVLKLHHGVDLNSCRPSVDYLFRSAASVYGAGTLALVMTGMGADGLAGARAVRNAGGTVLAQDEATSAVWGMAGRVAKEGLAAAVLPLERLAAALVSRVQSGRPQPGHGQPGRHAAQPPRLHYNAFRGSGLAIDDRRGRMEAMHGVL